LYCKENNFGIFAWPSKKRQNNADWSPTFHGWLVFFQIATDTILMQWLIKEAFKWDALLVAGHTIQ